MKDGPSDLAADADGVVVTTERAVGVPARRAHGHVRWRVPPEELGLGQPALGPDLVLVGGMGSVTALDRSDGSVRWHRPMTVGVELARGRGRRRVVSVTTPARSPRSTRAPAAHGGRCGIPGRSGPGARVDPATGAVVATWHQSDSPTVRVLDLATGALRWEAPTAGSPPPHGPRRARRARGRRRRPPRPRRGPRSRHGELQWQTPVPASFEEAIEPAVDDHAVAVVDHFGVVVAARPRDRAAPLAARSRRRARRHPGRPHRPPGGVHVVRGRPPRPRPTRRPRGATARARSPRRAPRGHRATGEGHPPGSPPAGLGHPAPTPR